jgi:hypothetical protein
MKSESSKWFWIVFGAGVALRVVFWCFQSAPAGDDGLRYLSEAYNMVENGVFSTAFYGNSPVNPPPSAHDLPLYASVLAAFYWLSGSLRAAQLAAGALNVLLCALGAVALRALLKNRPFELSERQAALACAVYMFMPESVTYSMFHMPDQLAVTVVLAGLFFYFKATTDGLRFLFGAVASFVVGIYSKPICLPLALALLFALVLLLKCAWWKRAAVVAVCVVAIGASLFPWTLRNERAFGTRGLTTISGTNLYYYNWGWFVDKRPVAEQTALRADMSAFEKTIAGNDEMLQSQKKGAYARGKLLAHFPQYLVHTMKTHPLLYTGTGTAALFRYFGREDLRDCLNAAIYPVLTSVFGEVGDWGKGIKESYVVAQSRGYTPGEKVFSVSAQVLSWAFLAIGYLLVAVGMVRGFLHVRRVREDRLAAWLVYLCPVLCLVLLAAVIGPVVAPRYRFIMVPFFAILAAQAICKTTHCAEAAKSV